MSDLRDFTGKNRKFTGTDSIKLPTGTTGQRVNATGNIRFNSTTNLAEYYDGTAWKPIDSPPSITGVTPTSWASDGSTQQTFTVAGSNFQSGATAKFVGNDGTEYTSVNLSITNSSQFTIQNMTTMTVANEPYDIILTNPSGLAATLEDGVDAGSNPSFTTAADTNLGTVVQGATDPTLTTAAATDADGTTVSHSVTSGSLPPGLSMATNAAITGTVGTISSSTDYTFTVTATDGVNAVTRQYVISGTPPPFMTATGGTITTDGDYKVHTFTSSGTFTVSAIGGDSTYGSKVEYLVVAGGGGGGVGGHGGAGGAGGYRHNSAYNFTVSAQAYSITVGAYGANRTQGGNSTFSNISSSGGGSGGHNNSEGGRNGGSGGGGSGHFNSGGGGSGNSPSVSPSQGNNGGSGQDGTPYYGAGGGGGAGQAGQNGSRNSPGGGDGGNGSANDIHGSSRTYSAGGGGHGHNQPGTGGSGGLGGNDNSAAGGRNTANNYGMGAGGANNNSSSGVVIIRYKFQ